MNKRTASEPGDLVMPFETAWNTHDMAAFADLFWPEATFVNRFGSLWRGEAIIAEHAKLHETIFRDTTLANRIQEVRMLAKDAAVIHVRTNASYGSSMPAGPRRTSAQLLLVATRREGVWRIDVGHNVVLIDRATGEAVLDP